MLVFIKKNRPKGVLIVAGRERPKERTCPGDRREWASVIPRLGRTDSAKAQKPVESKKP